MAEACRMSLIERYLVFVVFSSFPLSSVNTVDATKAPSYTDVFQYYWQSPTGETYECPPGTENDCIIREGDRRSRLEMNDNDKWAVLDIFHGSRR
ncbi:hypothetical protein NP493_241g05001 [Ridgeia piscesae]|uniref:Secreted protein n=1 Tax=Ridgeia piscesae TaxID=27915 RepID=A0AAD9NZH6_RIDPI|nr:hypothetical protein NP493_241g05001 [Ridgeia piscesae]